MRRLARSLAMRVRPKVILVTTYEDAMHSCEEVPGLPAVRHHRPQVPQGRGGGPGGRDQAHPGRQGTELPTCPPCSSPRTRTRKPGPRPCNSCFLNKNSLHPGRRALQLLLPAPGLRRLHLPGPERRGDRPGRQHGGPAGEAAHRAPGVGALPCLPQPLLGLADGPGRSGDRPDGAAGQACGFRRPGGPAHLPHQHGRLRPAPEVPGQGDALHRRASPRRTQRPAAHRGRPGRQGPGRRLHPFPAARLDLDTVPGGQHPHPPQLRHRHRRVHRLHGTQRHAPSCSRTSRTTTPSSAVS